MVGALGDQDLPALIIFVGGIDGVLDRGKRGVFVAGGAVAAVGSDKEGGIAGSVDAIAVFVDVLVVGDVDIERVFEAPGLTTGGDVAVLVGEPGIADQDLAGAIDTLAGGVGWGALRTAGPAVLDAGLQVGFTARRRIVVAAVESGVATVDDTGAAAASDGGIGGEALAIAGPAIFGVGLEIDARTVAAGIDLRDALVAAVACFAIVAVGTESVVGAVAAAMVAVVQFQAHGTTGRTACVGATGSTEVVGPRKAVAVIAAVGEILTTPPGLCIAVAVAAADDRTSATVVGGDTATTGAVAVAVAGLQIGAVTSEFIVVVLAGAIDTNSRITFGVTGAFRVPGRAV